MSRRAADLLVEGLIQWGVDTVFGMPGDGINGIIESLRKKRDQIRFIQVRHEEFAALMACGYAKWTDKLGVCLATSGPGGIHLLNGLFDVELGPMAASRRATSRPNAAVECCGILATSRDRSAGGYLC